MDGHPQDERAQSRMDNGEAEGEQPEMNQNSKIDLEFFQLSGDIVRVSCARLMYEKELTVKMGLKLVATKLSKMQGRRVPLGQVRLLASRRNLRKNNNNNNNINNNSDPAGYLQKKSNNTVNCSSKISNINSGNIDGDKNDEIDDDNNNGDDKDDDDNISGDDIDDDDDYADADYAAQERIWLLKYNEKAAETELLKTYYSDHFSGKSMQVVIQTRENFFGKDVATSSRFEIFQAFQGTENTDLEECREFCYSQLDLERDCRD